MYVCLCLQRLVKGKDPRLEKALTECMVYQELFKLFELQMPPVLSTSFYEPQLPPVQKLAVSTWFATRCCLLEVEMMAIEDIIIHGQPYIWANALRNVKKPDKPDVPSSTFKDVLKCCYNCKKLSSLLSTYCLMLKEAVKTLSGWLAPIEFCQAQDQIKSASEFIENPEVNRQFSINSTVRRQWLAVSLATLLKVWQSFDLKRVAIVSAPR